MSCHVIQLIFELTFKTNFLVNEKVFALLSVGSFVAIITQLLGGASPESGSDIQRKTVEILNSKLEGGKLKLQREHVCSLTSCISSKSMVIIGMDKQPYIYSSIATFHSYTKVSLERIYCCCRMSTILYFYTEL